ncbi:hypothetical protein GCM10009850_093140 [Nonomuraea monospora]|uniref:EF-hand domain-containing protein n=1 Tax=Nonomuraea monospora TaxID=568818 RepID=A0ABN3CWG5_9ACTN
MSVDPNFRLTRLRARFSLLDANGDGRLRAEDFALLAGRVCASLGADPNSAKALALAEGCRAYWEGLAAISDSDGDGIVTFQEYAAAVPDSDHFDEHGSPYARALTALADIDDDGQVEHTDFVACMTAIGFALPQVEQLFATLASHGGRVTTDAWSAAIKAYYVSTSAHTPGQMLASEPA